MWDCVIEALTDAGVCVVFGIPGDDMVAHHELAASPISLRVTGTQRNAVFMAAGAGRLTGEMPVVVTGRGPGVAGTVPALVELVASRTPLLLLTGGAPETEKDHRCFQPGSAVDLLAGFCRFAHRLSDGDDIGAVMAEAIAEAQHGIALVEVPDPPGGAFDSFEGRGDKQVLGVAEASAALTEALREAKRPLVVAGAGCHAVETGVVERFAQAWQLPVLVTASGRGSVDERAPQVLSVAGLYMTEQLRSCVAEADLVVSLGSRLEETALSGLGDRATFIQLAAVASNVSPDVPGEAFAGRGWENVLVESPQNAPQDATSSWFRRCSLAATRDSERLLGVAAGLEGPALAPYALRFVSTTPIDFSLVALENGLADMWSYYPALLPLGPGSRTFIPSEQTTLGCGVAAALGAAQQPVGDSRSVMAVCGDGALSTVLPDLPSLTQLHRGVLLVVFNNSSFGWLKASVGPVPSARHYDRNSGRLGEAVQALTGVPVTTAHIDQPEHFDASWPSVLAALDRCEIALLNIAVAGQALPPIADLFGFVDDRLSSPAISHGSPTQPLNA